MHSTQNYHVYSNYTHRQLFFNENCNPFSVNNIIIRNCHYDDTYLYGICQLPFCTYQYFITSGVGHLRKILYSSFMENRNKTKSSLFYLNSAYYCTFEICSCLHYICYHTFCLKCIEHKSHSFYLI